MALSATRLTTSVESDGPARRAHSEPEKQGDRRSQYGPNLSAGGLFRLYGGPYEGVMEEDREEEQFHLGPEGRIVEALHRLRSEQEGSGHNHAQQTHQGQRRERPGDRRHRLAA